MLKPCCYIGLMSGTSMDGIDAAAVEFSGPRPQLLASATTPYPAKLQAQLSRLLTHPEKTSLPLLLEMDHQIGDAFAAAANNLTQQLPKHYRIAAIGSHGQTVFHQPETPCPNSWQLGDANLISELTGVTTVADFRRRDMAAGGQGAPLVPAFHHTWLQQQNAVAVLNLGGIANLTIIPPKGAPRAVIGFDTGPANTLLDAWAQLKLGQPRDDNGDWAASGECDQQLLKQLLSDAYFALPPPKSTGREYFNIVWLEDHLKQLSAAPSDAAVAATLVELVARSVSDALHASDMYQEVSQLYVCGGGVHNTYLMHRLQDSLAPIEVTSSSTVGIDPDYMEAIAFAWLASKTLEGDAINTPDFTGARHSRILGAIYQA